MASYTWTGRAVRWIVEQVKANRQKLDKLQQSVDVDLPVSGWKNGRHTVSVDGVTNSNVVIVTVSRWGVACESQGTGTLTFSASILPSVPVTAHVSIINSL